MKRTSAFVGVALLAVALAIAAWPEFATSQKSNAQRETLSVGIYDGELSLLVLVAESQGFYAKNGLDVKISGYEAGLIAFDRLIAGHLDVATPADYVFANRSLQDNTLRVLASISTSDVVEFLARKDKGIAQPSDLKGKRIGTTLGTISEAFLRAYLLLRYISPTDVTMINLPPSQIVERISSGEIDAGVTWESFAYEIKKRLGANVLSWPAQDYQDLSLLLATRKDILEAKPKAIELFLKLDRGRKLSGSPDRAKAIATRWGRDPAYGLHLKHSICCLLTRQDQDFEANARR
jgi:NitT/TauT family transport system substrate-binding protein